VKLDIEFHQTIAKASGNRALQLCRAPISQLFYPAFLQVFLGLNAGERLVFARLTLTMTALLGSLIGAAHYGHHTLLNRNRYGFTKRMLFRQGVHARCPRTMVSGLTIANASQILGNNQ
jgi:hypothetical protein